MNRRMSRTVSLPTHAAEAAEHSGQITVTFGRRTYVAGAGRVRGRIRARTDPL